MLSARVHPRWESENGRMAIAEGLPSYKTPENRAKLNVLMFLGPSYKQTSRGGEREGETEVIHRGVDF